MRDKLGTRGITSERAKGHGEHAEHREPEKRIEGEATEQRSAADDEERMDVHRSPRASRTTTRPG